MSEAIAFVLISWLAADFIAGAFHWWEDQYAIEDWPIIGTLVAGPNALHHRDQTKFLRGGYWQRNWTTIVPTVLVGGVVTWFVPSLWLMFAFLTQANEVHAWSHSRCSGFIRMLQDVGALCSPEHHAKHHRDPFSKRFCVMSNWLNPVLDFLGFWRGLEWCVWRCLGVRAKSDG